MSEEDLLEYLPDAKFKLDDVKKFVRLWLRVML